MRLERDKSIPVHYETFPLAPLPRIAVWCVGIGGIAAGFTVPLLSSGAAARGAAGLLVVIGGIALVAAIRCARYEIVVGTVRIDAGTGPFRELLGSSGVESAERRRSTGWRRWYAREEVVLRPSSGQREVVLPSRDPAALIAAIGEVR